MDFFFDAIASALAYFYDLTGSYGLSIMLLTLGVMVIVTPLTLKSTRSMIAMQQLQPELRKLQVKYKDDRQKLNEEMMAFYKEHDINPLGGCLPLLVQMPVFFVLYQVLQGLTWHQPYGRDMGVAVGNYVRDPAGGGVHPTFGTFDPKYVDQGSNLYHDLSQSRHMRFLGLDLADWFTRRLSEGLVAALPYLILVLVVAATAWYQQRQIMARNSGQQAAINPQQQALMKIMPFFLPVFSLTLQAGLVLYFVVSNVYRIGQQGFITRTMYSEKAKAEREAQLRRKLGDGGDEPAPPPETGGLLDQIRSIARGGPADSGGTETSGGETKGGKGGSSGGATATKRSPNRQAPTRAPSNQNRSKKKKKRR